MKLRKDETLDRLADVGNVAQFAAYRSGPEPSPSFNRIRGLERDSAFPSIAEAARALLERSVDGRINVRSYSPEDPRSREFVYGLTEPREASQRAEGLLADGLDVILNETIDIHDGGVSGVAHADALEFAPDDTPRCVEAPEVASLPRELGLGMLETVYGFAPRLPSGTARVEFSIHPHPRGLRHDHTVLWEREEGAPAPATPRPRWPNRFSRHIGDKAFGLLVAFHLGEPVPRTLVVGRRVAPFTFGIPTGSRERWIRTAPAEPQPGRFTTIKGWTDPFALMMAEDPDASMIPSVLAQAAVLARFSGAAIVTSDGELVIEGREGEGAGFMQGTDRPRPLPPEVIQDVAHRHRLLSDQLGPVRLEWVHDGGTAWIVQLHVGATRSQGDVLYPGTPSKWVTFDVRAGLAALRELYRELPDDTGVRLVGEVGLTSHIADLARRTRVPTIGSKADPDADPSPYDDAGVLGSAGPHG